MKYGIFIDLDGTLFNDNSVISLFDKTIIRNIKNYINIYLVTGKSYHSVKYIYDELGLNTKLITSMGQVVTSQNGKTLYEGLHVTIVLKLIKDLKKLTSVRNYALENAQGNFFISSKNVDNNLLDLINYKSGSNIKNIHQCDDVIVGTFIETNVYSIDEIHNIKKAINILYKNECYVTYWQIANKPYVIFVRSAKVNKWIRISEIKKQDNLDKIMSIGNGWNDIEMLEKSEYGVAMVNSEPNIIKHANYVTKYTNNESGVGKFIHNNMDIFK